jgi:hypothetical protein
MKSSGTEDPNMSPCSFTHVICEKAPKTSDEKKDSLFNKWCWENCVSTCRKLKLDPCLSPCTSINLKWIKDFIIRPESLKLVQERARNTLEALGISKDLLSRTQLGSSTKTKKLTKETT